MLKLFYGLIILVILVLILLYFNQRALIFHPQKITPTLPNQLPLKVVHLITTDQQHIYGWYAPAQPHHQTFIFLHGNAGDVGMRTALATYVINRGYGILLVEYRGYGGNKGKPTEQGLYLDAEAGWQFLVDQGLKPKDIIIYGESLGTAVASHLAVQHPACALILQSPFTSMAEVARFHYPWILIKPWDKFDTYARIRDINMPLLVIHGTVDTVVPYSEGLAVYEQAKEPKSLITLNGGGHSNFWQEDFFAKVLMFVNEHGHRATLRNDH